MFYLSKGDKGKYTFYRQIWKHNHISKSASFLLTTLTTTELLLTKWPSFSQKKIPHNSLKSVYLLNRKPIQRQKVKGMVDKHVCINLTSNSKKECAYMFNFFNVLEIFWVRF